MVWDGIQAKVVSRVDGPVLIYSHQCHPLQELSQNNSSSEENSWDGHNPRKQPERVGQGEAGKATEKESIQQGHE